MPEYLPYAVALLVGVSYWLVGAARATRSLYPTSARVAADKARLGQFAEVAELQVATNRHHYKAVLQKVLFQSVGLMLAVLAPAAIMAAALSHGAESSLTALGWQTVAIGTVTLTVLLLRRPTARWTRSRMRAETLRLHTHVCLAGLPPYDGTPGAPAASATVAKVEEADMSTLLKLVEELKIGIEQSQGRTALPVDATRANAYVSERVQEQVRYFTRSARNVALLIKVTGTAFRLLLVGALVASGAQWTMTYLAWDGRERASLVLHLFIALVTLVLTTRAVFGWESRLGVYEPMLDRREAWKTEVERLRGQSWGSTQDADWQGRFKALAASIEVEMADEGLKWQKAVERELYETPV